MTGEPATRPLLLFSLKEQLYGLEIEAVVQIINLVNITPLPFSPPMIRGAINFRGRIVPVIDLRLRFGWPFKAYHLDTKIIVVDLDGQYWALAVDEVQDVVQISLSDWQNRAEFVPRNWEQAPSNLPTESGPALDALVGAAHLQGQIVPILRLSHLLTPGEKTQLGHALEHHPPNLADEG